MVFVLSELKFLLKQIKNKEDFVVYVKNLVDDEYYTIETISVVSEGDVVLDIKYSSV